MLLKDDGTYTERGQAIIGHTPMCRFGNAEELAGAVIWLASPRASGFVIYSSSLDRNAQAPIAEGAQVRDKQLLIRLPDTTSMKADVRIPEAQRGRVFVDENAPGERRLAIELQLRIRQLSPVNLRPGSRGLRLHVGSGLHSFL